MTGQAEGIAQTTASPEARASAKRFGLVESGVLAPLPVYAAELWGRRYFILSLARARNAAIFSESSLGQLWQVLTPLLNAGVYFLIFGLLLDTKRGVDNFIAFLVAGVFTFNYTQRVVLSGARAITGNMGLVRALHFPRATLPLSAAVQELEQLLVANVVLIVIVLGTGEPIRLSWLLLIPALVTQTVFNAGIALAFARLTSRVRDLEQLLPFLLRTWQYTSGVFFSIDHFARGAPTAVQVLLHANPAVVYIEIVRAALLESYPIDGYVWALAVGWAVVMFSVGFVYFWRAEESYGRG